MNLLRRSPVVAALVFAALGATAVLAWVLRQEVILLFASILFGTALYVVSSWLSERTGLNHRISVVIWYLAGVLLAVAFATFAGQRVSGQYGSLSERIPAALEQVEERLEGRPVIGSLADEVRQWRVNLVQNGQGGEETQQSEAEQQEAESQRSQLVRLTIAGVSSFLIWAVLAFYFAFDGERYVRIATLLVPPARRHIAEEVFACLGGALPWWLVGRLASMGVVAVLTAIGLTILGIPVAFTLALMAGLFSFVPFLGPIAALVPAILVTLESVPDKLVWVLVVYGVVQFLESYVVTPRIQDRVVSVLPVVLISAQVIMGVLVGVAGVMFATPLVLTLMVVLQIVYLKHGLGEEVRPPRAPSLSSAA